MKAEFARNGGDVVLVGRQKRTAATSQNQLSRIAPNKRPMLYTLPEQVAKRIAEQIVNETFSPGQRLKEGDLSEAFGVSRASIREALRLLELSGLVQIESRRGARVTLLSAEEIDDLYEIRASLLGLAARRAASRRNPAFTVAAESLLARLDQSASQPTQGTFFEAAYAFSNLIADWAGSQRLAALIRSFSQPVARYTRLSLRSTERRKKSVQNFKRLVVALKTGDAARAESAIRDLVFGSRDAVREILQNTSTEKAA